MSSVANQEHELKLRLREWVRGWFERFKTYNEYFESIRSKIINEYNDRSAIIKKELQMSGILGDRIADALLRLNCEWMGRSKGVMRGWHHIRCGDYYIELPSSVNEMSEKEKIQEFYDEAHRKTFLIELEYDYADLMTIVLFYGGTSNAETYVRIKFNPPELEVVFSKVEETAELVVVLSYSQDSDEVEIRDLFKKVYRDGDVVYEWNYEIERQAIQFVLQFMLEHMQDFDRALTELLQIMEIGFREFAHGTTQISSVIKAQQK